MRQLDRLTKCFKKKAQALLELAIFGSFLMMLLGILLYYGMIYNKEHSLMQRTFRNALASAAVSMQANTPTSASYLILEDKHIPNPQDPWGIGSVRAISASASSPTRSWRLDEMMPENTKELPRIVISMPGWTECPNTRLRQEFGDEFRYPPCHFLLAGFKEENDVPENSIKRYRQAYGQIIQGCAEFSGGSCTRWDGILLGDEGDDDVIRVTCPGSSDVCISIIRGDEGDDDVIRVPCPGSSDVCISRIRIIDPAEGEIIDHNSLVRQCRMIVDVDACIIECQRGGNSDCSNTCNNTMNVPWYCANYTEINTVTHQYVFPVLNQLFFLADARKAMGIQPDYDKTKTRDNVLSKTEDNQDIETQDTWDWNETTQRSFVYKSYRDESGNATEEGVTSSVSQDETQVWTTPW